jgi:hypothetical protein
VPGSLVRLECFLCWVGWPGCEAMHPRGSFALHPPSASDSAEESIHSARFMSGSSSGPTAIPSPPPFASPCFTSTHALQHPLLATRQTSVVVTTAACLDYRYALRASHTRTMHQSTASPGIYVWPTPNGYSVWHLAPPCSRQDTATHTLLATQTSAVVTTPCRDDRYTRLPERCANPLYIHGLADIHTPSLLPTDIGCGALAPCSRPGTD